jgi:gag-polypeptide of LTR copia-type
MSSYAPIIPTASGILMELIAPDQERHIEDYTSAKDFWDRLKVVHQSAHTGIAAFYMKVGMMKREYVEGESMQVHIDFLLGKNKKLAASKQAFDDEFMAQLILMSLPSPSLWDTIIVTLLQSVSDTKKLSTVDVTARLLQEATRITGPTQSISDAALYAKNKGLVKHTNKPPSKRKRKTCGFCQGGGHVEDVCRKKAAAMER